jgi:predicted nucleic acid-binding protein
VSDQTDSLLDTNIFVHAQANDQWSEKCRRFLAGLQRGTIRSRLEPAVLHELTYVLPRYLRQLGQHDVGTYLRSILSWPGIQGDIALMDETLRRWSDTPRLGFVDPYLAALAARHGCPVHTKNVSEIAGQGLRVPDPLPDGSYP